jgi:hypothetical protein
MTAQVDISPEAVDALIYRFQLGGNGPVEQTIRALRSALTARDGVLSQCRTALKRAEGGMRGVCDVVPNPEAYSIIDACVAAVAAIDAKGETI